MKKYCAVLLLVLLSCNQSKEPDAVQSETVSGMNTEVFRHKLVVILAEEVKKDAVSIRFQDFYDKSGKTFIPVFSSVEKFNESTRGELKEPKIAIDGIFLLSLLKGNETLKLNPGLKDEMVFKASGLIGKYAPEIKLENQKMKTPGKK